MGFKFAHLADIHIGGYRDPKLKELTQKSFELAVDKILSSDVDFVIICGDLFNTPLPGIDFLNSCVVNLKRLKEESIPVYAISGSHDFSLSGKTILNVLESADLIKKTNNAEIKELDGSQKVIFEPTIDEKTKSLLVGVSGKKGSFDKDVYEFLDVSNLDFDNYFSIFMFHNGINEMLPKNMDFDALNISNLPKGFDYYAGGHIHYTKERDNPKIVFPGPTFPENFSELEKLSSGSFKIVEVDDNKNISTKLKKLHVKNVIKFNFDFDGFDPYKATNKLINSIESRKGEIENSIVLIRAKGMLDGKTTDINFRKVFTLLNEYGAYVILRNTMKLRSENIEMVDVNDDMPIKEMELEVINDMFKKEHIPNLSKYDDYKVQLKSMIDVLSEQRNDDEKKKDYEKRIVEEFDVLFKNLLD